MQSDLGKNYFELFDLPVTFDLDGSDLAKRYHELQRHTHPDKFAAASNQERRLSVQLTALINEAFQTLRDPLRRGRYLLGLHGIDTDDETDTVMDPVFLAEQMALRERLAETKAHSDPVPRLAELAGEIKNRLRTRTKELSKTFAEDSAEGHERARRLIREMQFFAKLDEEVEELEEELIS